MPFLDILHVDKIKAELEQVKKKRDMLRTTMAETGRTEALELRKAIATPNGKIKPFGCQMLPNIVKR